MRTWLLAGIIALAAVPAVAGGQPDAAAAITRAEAAAKEAAALHDQWTPTIAALHAARAAAARGDTAAALRFADRAELLAGLSIRQAREQQHLWRNAVPH
jgi:hypothetical protein